MLNEMVTATEIGDLAIVDFEAKVWQFDRQV